MSESELVFQESQPIRADAVKNRAHLLEVAARLFADATYRGDTIESVSAADIAEAAGVGKGTLYRHFPNGKTDLCLALLDEDQRSLQERSLAHLRKNPKPLDSLHWFLSEVLSFVERNRPLLCASATDKLALTFPAHWWWRQTIYGLLAQLGAPGDLDYTADLLYIMVDIRTIDYLLNTRGFDMGRVRQNIHETVDRLVGR